MAAWPKLTETGTKALKEALRESIPTSQPNKYLAQLLVLTHEQARNILERRSTIDGKYYGQLLKELSKLPRDFFKPSLPYVTWDHDGQPKPASPVGGDILDRILTERTARVGILNYPPLLVWNAQLPPKGLYGDLLRHVGESENISWKCHLTRVGEAADKVKNGELDFVLSVFETAERREKVDFCCLMHSIGVSVVIRKSDGKRFKTTSDIWGDGTNIAVADGEIGHEIVSKKIRDKAIHINLDKVVTDQIRKVVSLVGTRDCDAAVADSLSCACAMRNLAEVGIRDLKMLPPMFTCHNGIMVAHGQPRMKEWLADRFPPALRRADIAATEAKVLKEYAGLIAKF